MIKDRSKVRMEKGHEGINRGRGQEQSEKEKRHEGINEGKEERRKGETRE
jgi:hypothetical protein